LRPSECLPSSEIERCEREIAGIEAALRGGHRDVPGLCLALSDWSAELRILEDEKRRQGKPGCEGKAMMAALSKDFGLPAPPTGGIGGAFRARARRVASFGLGRGLGRLLPLGRDVCRRWRNVGQKGLYRLPDSGHGHLAVGELLTKGATGSFSILHEANTSRL